ncbi:MAG: metallophosphoesterase family protein [Candidatus Hydrothermarchaeaceae archaeon]
MEIAIISDIHSNLSALKTVLKEIGRIKIFCSGDLVGYNPYPNEVIETLRKREVISIMGNHDHALIAGDTSQLNPIAASAIKWTAKKIEKENLDFLRSLPEVNQNNFYMVHGSPQDSLYEYVHEDYPNEIFEYFFAIAKKDVIALGHTHVPFVRRFREKLIFNSGSVGQPRDFDPRASFAILDTGAKSVDIIRVEYDIGGVAGKIIEEGLPGFLAERLFRGV